MLRDGAVSTREATAELLSRAYSTIAVSDVALAMGFARHEDAAQCESSFVWLPAVLELVADLTGLICAARLGCGRLFVDGLDCVGSRPMGLAETAGEYATWPFDWRRYGSTRHVVKDGVASGTKHSGHDAVM